MPEVEQELTEQLDNNGAQAVDDSDRQAEVDLWDNEPVQVALKNLVKYLQGLDKSARRQEVIEARRQRFYERGDQYIYWNATAYVFAPVSGGASVQTGDDSVEMPRYTEVYNIYQPYERSLIAVLTQNPPGVNFEADDPTNAADISASNLAEKYRHQIDRANERKTLQAEIARLFCTDGRVVLWTRTIRDAQKFGMNDETGEPNAAEIITAHGVLESKVPITAQCFRDWTYCGLSKEIDIHLAKQNNPKAADKIKQGSSSMGESSYERMARLGVLQSSRLLMQAGDAYQHLVTESNFWMRPAAFEKIGDDTIKQQVQGLFPEGCRAKFVADAFCGAWNESMDDHLAVGHPYPGDGQARMSMLKPIVPIQDAFNDLMNMRKEIYDYCIPSRWADTKVVDIDAIRDQVSEPGAYRAATGRAGEPLENGFYEETPPTTPADMVEALKELQGPLPQFQTGALPSLFGGEMEGNDTASGYAMARDQAMGQIGLPWGAMQELFATAYKQAVLCAAQNRDESEVIKLKLPDEKGRVTTEQIPIADLKKGSFHCYPDLDSSFPETTAAKRAAYNNLMTMSANSPYLQQVLTHPDNAELGKNLAGLEDLVIPGADAEEKQLREIEELLKTAPIPPTPEEMDQAGIQHGLALAQSAATGQPPPPEPTEESLLKPSVPIDPECDYHEYEWPVVQRWLSSEERAQEEKNGNLVGIMNVRLHGLAHKAMIQQQIPPMIAAKGQPNA